MHGINVLSSAGLGVRKWVLRKHDDTIQLMNDSEWTEFVQFDRNDENNNYDG